MKGDGLTYIAIVHDGLAVDWRVIPNYELHRLATTFAARQPDRSIYGGWHTLNLIEGIIEREFDLPRSPRLRYWIRRWLLNHGYEMEPRKRKGVQMPTSEGQRR